VTPWKILVVDDEPDLELLITQRFRRQIRAGEFTFRFARDGRQDWRSFWEASIAASRKAAAVFRRLPTITYSLSA